MAPGEGTCRTAARHAKLRVSLSAKRNMLSSLDAHLRHGMRFARHVVHVHCHAVHAAQQLDCLVHLLLADDWSRNRSRGVETL